MNQRTMTYILKKIREWEAQNAEEKAHMPTDHKYRGKLSEETARVRDLFATEEFRARPELGRTDEAVRAISDRIVADIVAAGGKDGPATRGVVNELLGVMANSWLTPESEIGDGDQIRELALEYGVDTEFAAKMRDLAAALN